MRINRAYLLKESFRPFWDYTYRARAQELPGPMDAVGHPFPLGSHARLRLDGKETRGGHPQLLPGRGHQRFRGGDEPQGQDGLPEGLRVQVRSHLPAGPVSCTWGSSDAGNDPQILVRNCSYGKRPGAGAVAGPGPITYNYLVGPEHTGIKRE